MTSDYSMSMAVLTAIAEREGIDAGEFGIPLYEVIDPDALEVLFKDDTGQVTFEYQGYTVTVDHTGDVDLSGLDA